MKSLSLVRDRASQIEKKRPKGTANDVEVDELIPVGWSAADWTMSVDLDENLEARQGVTEEDVLNDVRRMYGSDNSDEHEADVGFQEENEEVTHPSRRDMLLAMQTLRDWFFAMLTSGYCSVSLTML